MNGIDKSGDRPIKKQIADVFREKILSGELAAGDTLPSEPALAEMFDVARGTIVAAMDILRSEGLILSERGRHHRVRPVRVHSSQRYAVGQANYNPDQESRFAAEHGVPWSRFDLTREYRTIPAPPRVANALGIEVGTPVCERLWTHATGGVMLRVSWSYLDMARFGGTILTDINEAPWPGGTIAQLEHLGYHVKLVPTDVRARQATEQESAILGLEVGAWVLEAWRVQLAGGIESGAPFPVEAALHVYPAGAAALSFEVPVNSRKWALGAPD